MQNVAFADTADWCKASTVGVWVCADSQGCATQIAEVWHALMKRLEYMRARWVEPRAAIGARRVAIDDTVVRGCGAAVP